MLALIQKIFGRENNASKDIAKERLRLVLVHDRASVSPQIMEAMRDYQKGKMGVLIED